VRLDVLCSLTIFCSPADRVGARKEASRSSSNWNYFRSAVEVKVASRLKAEPIHESNSYAHAGGPELLAYEDAPKPALQPGDALVRVIATSITKTELTWDETYRDCDGRPRIPTIPGTRIRGAC